MMTPATSSARRLRLGLWILALAWPAALPRSAGASRLGPQPPTEPEPRPFAAAHRRAALGIEWHQRVRAPPNGSGDARDDEAAVTYLVSPVSQQLVKVKDMGPQPAADRWFEFAEPPYQRQPAWANAWSWPQQCRTLRARLELSRELRDGGRLLGHCRGVFEVNRCEGTCSSRVEPSAKAPLGLTKECACCREASFRRLSVRLDECSYDEPAGRRLVSSSQQLPSQLEVDLWEPVECRCRRCD